MTITMATLATKPTYPDSAPSFRFVVASDMPVNPVSWVVDGYVEDDSVVVVYGRPGSGKSFFALDVSCCLASGIPFHGCSVKKGAVFYIAGEGHNGLARRLRAWAEHNGEQMPEHLFISEAPAELSSAASAASVAEAVEQLANVTGEAPALIVVDTLARNFGGDENSATDMGQFVRNADALRRRWKATVLIVHHSGKDGDRGARGSSALKGAADAEYEISRNEGDKLIRLTPKKMKDAEEPEPLAFELIPVPITDDTGEPILGAALQASEYMEREPVSEKLGRNQILALEELTQLHNEIAAELERQGRGDCLVNVTLESWKERCLEAGIPRQRYHDVKNSLAERQHISFDGPHVYLVRPELTSYRKPDRTDGTCKVKTGQSGQKADENRTPSGQDMPRLESRSSRS